MTDGVVEGQTLGLSPRETAVILPYRSALVDDACQSAAVQEARAAAGAR